ncbi:MAG TPA: glycoside hydrolase family 15 protein [Humibacter sp.]|nr:glycoside hydrolase family 15 protein [Humibacter sp.]
MPLAIEDYALISDSYTGALVGRDGSIDWMCMPRYDSPSIFGALLGSPDQGRWLLAPADRNARHEWRYDGDSFILVHRWVTDSGEVEVIDYMPHGDHRADLVRRVRGVRGTVQMHQELRMRFAYGSTIPWVRQLPHEERPALLAVAGPDALIVRGPALHPDDHVHKGDFTVTEGEYVDTTLTWFPSHRQPPDPIDAEQRLEQTQAWWAGWASRCSHEGPYRDEVIRSLLVLRALTHEETGGIVAAATTSLPEQVRGGRNWDYRYVWLRDASQTLMVLLSHGFDDEVRHWRDWLLRAVAGDPADVQIMYGLAGERDLPERELTTLPGYLGAAPVRIGNGAADQFQADVIGEVMIALQRAREAGIRESKYSWAVQRALMGHLEKVWQEPDQGIWEIRGTARSFTHSHAMVWAAFDRAVRGVEEFGLPGPVERWRAARADVRKRIEAEGIDLQKQRFTQYFGGTGLDAALLQLPQVGFCEFDDPLMVNTVAGLEEELFEGGLLMRYRTEGGVDGLPPGEFPFLACSFWLVEQYALSGRLDDAGALMDRLVGFANDLGLLSEEYDPAEGHQAGNTPQALTHLALVRAADAITEAQQGS